MSLNRTSALLYSLFTALAFTGCVDRSVVEPELRRPDLEHKRDYTVNTVSCQTWWITGLPSDAQIRSSTPDGWIQSIERSGSSATVTDCVSYTQNIIEIEDCRNDPYSSNCQPVLPTLDAGSYNFGSSGGSGSQGTAPSWILDVSRCNYRLPIDNQNLSYEYRTQIAMQCNRPFTAEERAVVQMVMDSLLRASSDAGFTSDSARQECADLRGWLSDALTDSIGFGVGVTNSSDHDGASATYHVGHIDPDLFDNVYMGAGVFGSLAQKRDQYRGLLRMLLHEPGHSWGGKSHKVNGVDEVGPDYTTPYYKWISSSGGTNTCVR